MRKDWFKITPHTNIEHFGVFDIADVPLEALEVLHGLLVDLVAMPVGPTENATSATYREVAQHMLDEIRKAIAPQHGGEPIPAGTWDGQRARA